MQGGGETCCQRARERLRAASAFLAALGHELEGSDPEAFTAIRGHLEVAGVALGRAQATLSRLREPVWGGCSPRRA